MAEQKCPMCGKLNPPELDVCQYCEARLKPLIVNPSEDPQSSSSKPPSETPSEESSTPDWLRSLRDRQGETEIEPDEDDLPDWPQYEEDERPELPLGDEAGAPDWLDSLRDPASLEEDAFLDAGQADDEEADRAENEDVWVPPGQGAGEEDALPDWLTGMRASPESPDQPVDSLQADEEGESPDWLERIRSQHPGENPSEDAEPEQQQDLPDWLRTEDLSIAGTMADWPSSIRDRADESSEDWPHDLPPAESDDALPDWLSGAKEHDHATAASNELLSSSSEEIPDWLESEDEQTSSADEFPDWLETGESQPDEQATESESPNWMAEQAKAAEPSTDEIFNWSAGEREESPADDTPDWLQTSADTSESDEESPAGLSAAGLPDWLVNLDQKVEADEAETVADAEQTGLTAEPAQELPDWLADVGPAMEGITEESLEETPDSAIIPLDKHPDDDEDELSAYPDEGSYELEVPDWLADEKASEQGIEPVGETAGGPKEADLAPAELPSWLEAMRPVEAETAPEVVDERDRQVVSAGPLAGLRGVLAAEPEISKVQKPPAYSVKLQVSDMQQERASMLEELVQVEGIARPIPKRPLVSSQNLLRMIFAFVMFLAILWPLVTGGPVAPVPVFAPETGAANQLIGRINSQDPVLVAVDYQPGLSGEMDAVASALLDHLMLRGAYLTLVSTTVSGPIQAEHVVTISNQLFGHSYLGAGEYTNLGYIPGGPTGLISFASNPRAMMTYALNDGRLAWENSPLQNVQNLADFALVTVITENPETARAWVEQVQPVLGEKPLIMAISAQAEPMVRPYYEAFPKQVQGMVVGLAGSVAYESLMGHQGLSHGYWNSFGIGLLVAVVLIFIGGVFNMIPILSKGKRENSAEREGSR